MSDQEQQSISGETGHSYFHMMLNMADDDLDPFQYRLLGHYLRWAKNGGAFQESIKKTAHATQMSVTKVRSTRDQLVELGYLFVYEPTTNQRGDGISAIIEVRDRWAENIARFQKTEVESDEDRRPDPNLDEVVGKPDPNLDEPPDPNLAHIEELKSLKKEETTTPAKPGTAPAAQSVDETPIGLRPFINTETVKGDPEISKKKPREFSELSLLIMNEIGSVSTPLRADLQKRIEPIFSDRYCNNALYRKFIHEELVSGWTKIEGGKKRHLCSRESAVNGIVLAENAWLAYQAAHQPDTTGEGWTSEQIAAVLDPTL